MDDLTNLISQEVDYFKPDQLKLLERLCNIDSGSQDVEGNKQVVEVVSEKLKMIGMEVIFKEVEGYGTHLIGNIKPKNSLGKIVLAAHMDTVFNKGDTEKHPFRIEGEYAYGLGAADCKGGIVTILSVMETLTKLNKLPNYEIMVIFNCDEEIGSPTSQDIFKLYASDADTVLSFEPGRKENGVLTQRYGVVEGSIKINGKSAHACMDGGPGANAVVELANIILLLDKKENFKLGIHYNVAPISGGKGPSVVADYSEARFWATMKNDDAYKQIEEDVLVNLPKEGIINGCDINTSLELKFPPMEEKDSYIEAYNKLNKSASQLGLKLPKEMSKSPADCNFYSTLNVPVIDGLGPYMFNIHTVEEHILISSLAERIKLVSLFLTNY